MVDRMRNYRVLLQAEEEFARAVALGVIVRRPPSVWYFLIPGFFVLEHLRRSEAIRRYSRLYLFPRKLALDLAMEGKGEIYAQQQLQGWLSEVGLYSPEILQRHLEQVRLLLDHYQRLLQAEGRDYATLVRSAYGSREAFEGFLKELSAAERAVDEALIKASGDEGLRERLQAEQEQAERLRIKAVETIFG